MQKTVIGSEAFLVSFEYAGQQYRVLWGVIASDETGRWSPGDYVCTTPIQATEDLGEGVTRFKTRSGSTYETRCPVTPYTARDETDVRLFMAGVSPGELDGMKALKEKMGDGFEWTISRE